MAQKVRELCAGLIIRDRRILLVHNVKHGRRVEPPGGKREPNSDYDDGYEPYEHTVKRELKEELGIIVEVGKKLGAYRTISPEGIFYCHMYFCTINSGEPTPQEPDVIDQCEWYSYNQLLKLKEQDLLVPNMVDALEDLKSLL